MQVQHAAILTRSVTHLRKGLKFGSYTCDLLISVTCNAAEGNSKDLSIFNTFSIILRTSGEESLADMEQPSGTSWLFQTRVLFVRSVRTWYRTPYLFFSFLIQYIFAGVFIGMFPSHRNRICILPY